MSADVSRVIDAASMRPLPTATEIVARFEKEPMGDEALSYLSFHARRYSYLLAEAAAAVQVSSPRILDIGVSFQTALLRDLFVEGTVDTLGFEDSRWFPPRGRERHIPMDLNSVQDRNRHALDPYTLVVCAEVIEHLYTPPRLVLDCIREWIAPGGKLLLQTPNPVSLGKRLALLRGVSPFEPIRESPGNPGHFCEYTVEAVRRIAEAAGYRVEKLTVSNYFGRQGIGSRLYNAVCRLLPEEFRDGITVRLAPE